jgi:hypothetical protein
VASDATAYRLIERIAADAGALERIRAARAEARTRVIVRREIPHPGAQLSFTDHDGHRFQAILTDQPDTDVTRASGSGQAGRSSPTTWTPTAASPEPRGPPAGGRTAEQQPGSPTSGSKPSRPPTNRPPKRALAASTRTQAFIRGK